jgi:hypothetical protein
MNVFQAFSVNLNWDKLPLLFPKIILIFTLTSTTASFPFFSSFLGGAPFPPLGAAVSYLFLEFTLASFSNSKYFNFFYIIPLLSTKHPISLES